MNLLHVAKSEIRPTQPFDFTHTLRYFQTSPSSILETVEDDKYYRGFSIDGRQVLVSMQQKKSVDDGSTLLSVEMCGECLDEVFSRRVVTYLKHIFLLEADPEPFYQLSEKDAVLGPLITQYHGVRPMLIPDPYEALMWAIIGQQINVTFARKLKQRLVETFGTRLERDGRIHWLMPAPETIAGLSDQTLRDLQFSRQKTNYLLTLSEAVATGQLDFESIRCMPFDEAYAYLTRFKGIGRWTAEYLLMRGFGSPDVIPAGDLGLRAILGSSYELGRHASEEEVRQIADSWSPMKGWAAFLLWYQLQIESFMKKR